MAPFDLHCPGNTYPFQATVPPWLYSDLPTTLESLSLPSARQVNTAVICLGVKNTNVLESESVTAGRDPGDGSVQLPHFIYKETDAQGCAVTCLKSYNGLVAIYF